MASTAQSAATDTKQEAYLLKPPRRAGRLSPRIQRKKKRLFLEAFAKTITIASAAEAADIDRSTHHNWYNTDPQYAKEFDELQEKHIDMAEQSLYQRAVTGWDEPVFHAGEQCGTIRKKDTTAVIFYLKNKRAEQWNDALLINGNLNHNHTHLMVPAAAIDHVMARALELRRAGAIELEAGEQESTGAPESAE